jgi:hypothetical protein
MTKKELMRVARMETERWNLPPGLVIAILFCYAFRISEGEPIESLFKECSKKSAPPDFQI